MFHMDTGVTMLKKIIISSLLSFSILFSHAAIAKTVKSFIHITDTHIKSTESIERFHTVLKDIENSRINPEFIINTGDITEIGSMPEYQSYKAVLDSSDFKFYHLIGNHDVRWSNVGKKRYEYNLGPLYQSIEFGPAQLILLDTGTLLEQYGHFSIESLNWLKQELEKIGKTKPIILGAHHPPFLEKKYIDNELELFKIIEDYNVILFLCGHGHQNKHWTLHGIDFLMTKAVMSQDPGYRILQFNSNNELEIYTKTVTTTKKLDFKRSLNSRKLNVSISVRSPRIDRVYEDNLPILMTIHDVKKAEISIDQRNWTELKQGGSKFMANFNISHLPEGQHTLMIKLNSANKECLKLFDFNINRGNTSLAFKVETRGEIQSTPIISDSSIIFGSNDGFLYSLNTETGIENWRFRTNGPITTEPIVKQDTLFFTSGDGKCYALNSQQGDMYWKSSISESIFSSPVYSEGCLYFGSSDSSMNCIASKDGSVQWRYKTGGFIKVKPNIKFEKILFGSWDGYFYCLEADSGNLVWKKKIHDNLYYSPATSNPLIVLDRVYFASHDHTVHVLDIDNGKTVWEHSDKKHKPGYSSPANFDNKVVFGSLSGNLFALDEQNGEEIWTTTLSDTLDPIFDSSPSIKYPQVVVGSIAGNLYGVHLDTGEKKWSYRLNHGYIFSSPVIKDDVVFIGSTDGYLYALKVL